VLIFRPNFAGVPVGPERQWFMDITVIYFSYEVMLIISLYAVTFTARCYAERGYATVSRLSVFPSVCL